MFDKPSLNALLTMLVQYQQYCSNIFTILITQANSLPIIFSKIADINLSISLSNLSALNIIVKFSYKIKMLDLYALKCNYQKHNRFSKINTKCRYKSRWDFYRYSIQNIVKE